MASQVPTATAGQVKEGRGLLRLQTDALGVPSQAPVCAGVDEGVGAGVCVGGAGMMEGFVSLLSSNLPKPCVERIVATRLMKINTKTPAPSFFLLAITAVFGSNGRLSRIALDLHLFYNYSKRKPKGEVGCRGRGLWKLQDSQFLTRNLTHNHYLTRLVRQKLRF